MSEEINGERVRQLRVALGATQTELSEALGFESNTLISRLENGRGAADASLITRLADALYCDPATLSSAPADVIASRPWLRAYADAPVKVVEGIAADNILFHEATSRLQMQRIAETIPRFDGDLNDPEAIEKHARVVRAAAGIDEDSVVRNVMRAAERLGCVILPLDDELGRHLGLSQYIDGVPHIRVSRPRASVPGDRQRFTVAHELGHLALHAHLGPPATAEDARRIENQAHRFAGAFMTPAQPLLEDLHAHDGSGRVTLKTLTDLKVAWGVAIKMLVVRLRQLGEIEDAQATSLYKLISKRGWNTAEPVEVRHETPQWFPRALAKMSPGQDVNQWAADRLGLGLKHVDRWSNWEPPLDASVLKFDAGRRQTSRPKSLPDDHKSSVRNLTSGSRER